MNKATKEKVGNAMFGLCMVLIVICYAWGLYHFNVAWDGQQEQVESIYQTLNDINNRRAVMRYEFLLDVTIELNMTTDTDHSGTIDFYQDKIDNYEPIRTRSTRINPLVETSIQLIPICAISVFFYFLGIELGKVRKEQPP